MKRARGDQEMKKFLSLKGQSWLDVNKFNDWGNIERLEKAIFNLKKRKGN